MRLAAPSRLPPGGGTVTTARDVWERTAESSSCQRLTPSRRSQGRGWCAPRHRLNPPTRARSGSLGRALPSVAARVPACAGRSREDIGAPLPDLLGGTRTHPNCSAHCEMADAKEITDQRACRLETALAERHQGRVNLHRQVRQTTPGHVAWPRLNLPLPISARRVMDLRRGPPRCLRQ
jgi:hypothetical protein